MASYDAVHDAAVAAGERYYFDPDSGLLVMTELAHLERGSCCESRCRHCPFGNQPRGDQPPGW